MKMSDVGAIDREVMLITQEECAEVTQAISKVFRFGFDEEYNGKSNREYLEEEVGDLLCMINLMIEHGLVSKSALDIAARNKMQKLEQWSNIT